MRVEPDPLPLSEAEPSGFLPDRIRHADAAEILRERCASQERYGSRRQSQTPRGGLCEIGDAGRVLAKPWRLETGERGDGHERCVDFSPGIQTCGNGSISSTCSHIRVSSSSARISSKFRRASSASRGSYAAPVRRSMTPRASTGPAAERKREMSRPTCKRRIGNGIASPRDVREPPSVPAREHELQRSLDARAEVEPPRETLRDLAHRRKRIAGARAGVGDRVLDECGADLRWAACPDVRPVERKHLRRAGRIDEVEGGTVRRCRRRRAASLRARSRCSPKRGGARRSTCPRAPCAEAPASSPRRTASTAVRNACSSGCPVPRSVASERAPTTSAARIGRSTEGTAAATAPGSIVFMVAMLRRFGRDSADPSHHGGTPDRRRRRLRCPSWGFATRVGTG